MSHEVETMAFTGDVPWHGLGKSIAWADVGNIQNFQIEAGLDWEVSLDNNHKSDGTPIDGSYYIERVSDGSVLGKSVTTSYQPTQNSEMFKFFERYIDAGRLHLHTAGSLFGGKKVWVMASPNKGFTLDGDDTVSSNAIFTLDHTGKRANTMMLSPIRVVCQNTWNLAKKNASDTIKHNHKVPFDREIMDDALADFDVQFDEFELIAKSMARHVLTGNADVEFFRTVFGDKGKDKTGKVENSRSVNKALAMSKGVEYVADKPSPSKIEEQQKKELWIKIKEADALGKTLSQEEVSKILSGNDDDAETDKIINAGYDFTSARTDDGDLTLWGAFQTVTNIVDHAPMHRHKAYKNIDGTETPDHHAERALYGAPKGQRDYKQSAYDEACRLVAA